jgi:hypothetical protein
VRAARGGDDVTADDVTAYQKGWACLDEGCYEHGNGENSDKEAEKHGKAFGHSTKSWMVPVQDPERKVDR